MKHSLFKALLFAAILFATNNAHAVYVKNMPVKQVQPNGDTVSFFVTGDEFYHRYHDADNFTIVQNRQGYWVYATTDTQGHIVPTPYAALSADPHSLGLAPGLRISRQEYLQRRGQWEVPEKYKASLPKTSGRNHGEFCNLVIFIRFADDTIYTRPLSSIDQMFSDSSRENSSSVYNYFKHASYNKLFIRTYYAPTPDSNRILSYKAQHPRSYYMPYTNHNTIGYTDYNERTEREFDLLVSAVNWINDSAPVPTSYNLDCDNDGYIDNVNFVVKGAPTGWSDLLWPHKWSLYGRDAYINGKQVSTFNLALEGAGSDYFGSSTFCHELFHSLSAPDLYHYSEEVGATPVGTWDLMASNSRPPQHSLAWTKYRYGNWLDSIPTITNPGTYTLHSIGDSVPGNLAYKFPSADPDQFYVVEYRDNTETFETTLPGKGLIIYRVDTRFSGNAGYDGGNEFNEIWVFRPNSTSDEESGNLVEAYFTPSRRRTEFSPSTNPFPYLSDGTRDLTFSISNISTPGNSCSFYYTNRTMPTQLTMRRLTSQSATLSWLGIGEGYRVYYRPLDSDQPYTQLHTTSNHITLTHLSPNTQYEWTVRALYQATAPNTYTDSSRMAAAVTFHTSACNNPRFDTIGNLTDQDRTGLPFESDQQYTYCQQIFTSDELGGPMTISTLRLHYAYTNTLSKTNCTIYLANTPQPNLQDTMAMVPLSQLSLVYSGPMNFTYGWNEIILDTPFHYNGTDNLVVAIDDNSAAPSRIGDKFFTHPTPLFMARSYYSDNHNPSPEQDSILGSMRRLSYRNNIAFVGCPNDSTHVYACIISDNESLGTVTGEGLYSPNQHVTIHAFPTRGNLFHHWSDNNTDNPRDLLLTSDTLLIAYFQHNMGIDQAPDGGFVVLTQGLTLSVHQADQQPIQLYNLLGRKIGSASRSHPNPATFTLPAPGVYILRVGVHPPIKLLVSGR